MLVDKFHLSPVLNPFHFALVNRLGVNDFDDQVREHASIRPIRVGADSDDLESQ